MVLACVMGLLGSRFVILNRLSEILNVFVILLVPRMTEGRYKVLLSLGIIIVFFFYMYIVINYGNIGVYPYTLL